MAIQATAAQQLGPVALRHLRSGKSVGETLELLLKADPLADSRQIAIVDRNGQVAAHTGKKCIPSANHATGDGFSVQANLMANDQVVPAMREFLLTSAAPFAERLFLCLQAGQNAGGDLRGQQSAGLLVLSSEADKPPLVNLHVADHPEALRELKRLMVLNQAYELMNQGDDEIAKEDHDAAISSYEKASNMVPDNIECRYWYGINLLNCGRTSEGKKVLAEIYKHGKKWEDLTDRIATCGIIEGKLLKL
jgi:uncharacterized Ntn-hydrolase superfamily protein